MKTSNQILNQRSKYAGNSQTLSSSERPSSDGWEGFIDVALWGGVEITWEDALTTLAQPLITYRMEVLRLYKEIPNAAERISFGWAIYFASVFDKFRGKYDMDIGLDALTPNVEPQGHAFHYAPIPTFTKFTWGNVLLGMAQGLTLQFKRLSEFVQECPFRHRDHWTKAFLLAERLADAYGLDAGHLRMNAFTAPTSPGAAFAQESIRGHFDAIAEVELTKNREEQRAKIEKADLEIAACKGYHQAKARAERQRKAAAKRRQPRRRPAAKPPQLNGSGNASTVKGGAK